MQVVSLSVAMTNSKRNGAPYRHLLLYGPPGTGKTMVAKRLVRRKNNPFYGILVSYTPEGVVLMKVALCAIVSASDAAARCIVSYSP